MTLTKDRDLLAAVRALQITHVLHKAKDRNIHLLSHLHSLSNDHGYQFLWGSYNHNAIHRKRLEYG